MEIQPLFERFVQERQFLKNVRPKTLTWYETSFRAFSPFLVSVETEEALRAQLKEGVISMAKAGNLAPVSLNSYSRCLNAFLNWLRKEGHVNATIRIERLKEKQCVIETLTDQQIERVVRYSPKGVNLRRVHVMALTALDCGLRASEVRLLRRQDVDFDNLLVKVDQGKGNKERIVPMSAALRRILFRHASKESNPQADFLFSTNHGSAVLLRNMQRDLAKLGESAGVGHLRFHLLRHTMATRFLRSGGSIAVLRRILGHASITTTMVYEHMQTADLTAEHARHSLLTSLRA